MRRHIYAVIIETVERNDQVQAALAEAASGALRREVTIASWQFNVIVPTSDDKRAPKVVLQ